MNKLPARDIKVSTPRSASIKMASGWQPRGHFFSINRSDVHIAVGRFENWKQPAQMRIKLQPELGLLRLYALGFLVCATTALADELPRELLLQCELKQTAFMTADGKTDSNAVSMKKLLRLKDGTVVNTDANVALGTNCKFNDGVIRCELQTNQYSPELNSTAKEHNRIAIVRETGELRSMMEIWTFKGKTTTGKPYIATKVYWSGACRTVGQPIF